eukprot:TRINITY_DN906_c0_g1_i1.p1 TRINITY_DN906_c0_g1~~TRINITY_DN906_c0_g1_i1.p1  ORF type:complete len:211 (+),score=40.56 TRINITY_DN906_c0_g1_i1:129-761(+)
MVDEEDIVVRRVMASDNNCLFSAVCYVMEHSREKAAELRQIIAATIMSNPEKYSDVVLGKPNAEYCEWILNPEKWGGAVELAILSDYYGREIAAYDTQSRRCDVYGQDKGYSERVLLIYDGIHYDALAVAPFPDAPEDIDRSIFSTGGSELAMLDRKARMLVDTAHRERKFTDTANFTLRCAQCQAGLKGQKEAIEHAKSTGHNNFQEYH